MTRSRRRCVAAVFAVTLVASACDGDDTETPPRTSETPPVEDAAPGRSGRFGDTIVLTIAVPTTVTGDRA